MRHWLCFDDFEEQDDTEREQDKEWEADHVSEEDGKKDEQTEEGEDGTIFARIQKELRNDGCNFFDGFQTPANDIPEGEIEASIFLQHIQLIFNIEQSKSLTRRASSSNFRGSVFR